MIQLEQIITNHELPPNVRHKALALYVVSQETFDEMFRYIYYSNKHVVRYAADVLSKITHKNPVYVQSHKKEVLSLFNTTRYVGLKSYIALMASKLTLTEDELGNVWHALTMWVLDKNEHKSVRVCALQGLYNLLPQCEELKEDFELTVSEIKNEDIPSLKAKIRAITIKK